jgi:hypothetical protein
MSKLNQLSIFPTPEEKEKLWERVSEAFAKKRHPSIGFGEFLAIGIQWVNEQIRPEVEALRTYSIQIRNSPTALTLEGLIESHKLLSANLADKEAQLLADHDRGYAVGWELAMSNFAANTILLSDLKKMTMQEIANLIGEDQ